MFEKYYSFFNFSISSLTYSNLSKSELSITKINPEIPG